MGFVVRVFVTTVSLLWIFAVVVSCSQQAADITQKQPMPEKPIEAVLKEHTYSLMQLPGVVGTAQGLCSGKPCVKVYVVKKTSNLVKQIPATLEGYTVKIQVTGEIKALDRK